MILIVIFWLAALYCFYVSAMTLFLGPIDGFGLFNPDSPWSRLVFVVPLAFFFVFLFLSFQTAKYLLGILPK